MYLMHQRRDNYKKSTTTTAAATTGATKTTKPKANHAASSLTIDGKKVRLINMPISSNIYVQAKSISEFPNGETRVIEECRQCQLGMESATSSLSRTVQKKHIVASAYVL